MTKQLELIMMKLYTFDGDIRVLSEEERQVLLDLLDSFCKQAGILPVKANGGMDIYLN